MSKNISKAKNKLKKGGVKMDESITHKQRKAAHLWFKQIAEIVRDEGITMNEMIDAINESGGLELHATMETIKYNLIHPIIRKLWDYNSTNKIKKQGEIEMIEQVVNKTLSPIIEENRIPPFPSKELFEEEQDNLFENDSETKNN